MAERASRRTRMTYSAKGFVIAAAILVLVCGGLLLFFVKGLYLLPDKVCESSVQRDVVIRTLPRARAADEWADHTGAGRDFTFGCRISTSGDSMLTGKVELRESSKAAWEEGYSSLAGTDVVRTSAGRVAALAQIDPDDGLASVYVPCEPKDPREAGASGPRALVAEASVVGKSRASGADLRQALTDFAYQLTRHAYSLAQCKEPRDFPEKLPRYGDHR
ncbi:hypothetical protein [Streptomyces sp. Caat 7-52]|uniref:hypothetical protein n=1 Tax=Streptomyces sp. Caat 7-52 TaxID=2949637 RepID=UPI002034F4EC|nr:hypothetical protein [Streptomyces sp. Caat 7-52]